MPSQAGNFQDKLKKNFLSLTGDTCSLDLTGEISQCTSCVGTLLCFLILLSKKKLPWKFL